MFDIDIGIALKKRHLTFDGTVIVHQQKSCKKNNLLLIETKKIFEIIM